MSKTDLIAGVKGPLAASSVMQKMVFVTGFARGGTSWLRDCIGSHPDVAILPRERVVFRDMKDPDEVRAYFQREAAELPDSSRFIVNKAPANAPHIGWAARAFPESRFVFIIRDPRDVLVSHQRGTKAWMKGANSTVEGCMSKIQRYYEGWLEAEGLPNVMLVRYEDLHQNFFTTMRRVLDFIGADTHEEVLEEILAENSFAARTKRANVEDRSAAKRRGVIGEWAQQLEAEEINWYKKSAFFGDFMRTNSYDWQTNTYANIVGAMKEAGVHFLSEEDLLARRLDPDRPNVVLQHDIDFLNEPWCFESVERTAEIEAEFGLEAAYNFLPLDDRRYGQKGQGPEQALVRRIRSMNLLPRDGHRRKSQKAILALIERIRSISPLAYIGLHVNACERYYPASAPDAGEAPEFLREIRAYLHKQVQDYRAAGVDFRIATAHGYGRGTRLPNNQHTREIDADLAALGITLFDVNIRKDLKLASSLFGAVKDVGGVLKVRRLGHGFNLTDPRAYEALPARSFIRFLTHPGNYHVDAPSMLATRMFARSSNSRESLS